MQKDLLKSIASTIAQKGGGEVIEILMNKKNVNENLISKKLNMTINQTRNILYKLLESGLVSFTRKKDKVKGGWYTYSWSLNNIKALETLKQQINEEIKKRED